MGRARLPPSFGSRLRNVITLPVKPASKHQKVTGWGRWPVEDGTAFRPEKRSAVADILREGEQSSYIARGLGRSYGDTATNGGGGHVIMTRLNRMLSFDAEAGVLECEAGTSLAEIIEALLPRGWFLPTTPGTKFVTVGGAIAHDVHGKNHHSAGTFGNAVESLVLLTPLGKTLTCSRETNADVFWATLGGAGMTGIILSATFKMRPVESAYFLEDTIKTKNIGELLDALERTRDDYPYSVSWVDCMARGASLGRGILMNGNHARRDELPSSSGDPFRIRKKLEVNVPVDLPNFAFNSLTSHFGNTVVYTAGKTQKGHLVDWDKYFYPLDAIHNWNRGYGKRGFTQYQFVVPLDQRDGLVTILEKVVREQKCYFAVLKIMGPQNLGMLSFPFEGFTLTMDMPVHAGLVPFLHELDDMLLEYSGRVYLAKDATLRRETFELMYPRVSEFKAVRAKLDPEGLLSSNQARRLGLAEIA